MKKCLIILALFTFVPFAHSAAVDEGAELAAIINAQADAKDKVLAGLGYLSERSANATTLAQNSYPFMHALKEALQSGVITKEDVQAYKDLFNPVTAPLASVMQSGAWNPRVERLYADLEVKYEAVQKTVQKQMPQEMQKEYEEQDEQVRAPDQPYKQVLLAPEGEQSLAPLDDDEALQEVIERSLQVVNEDDIALQAAIAESMQLQEEAKPEVVEAASSQAAEERAREQAGEQQKVEPVFVDIALSIDGQEKNFNVDIAKIQAASGTIKDMMEDVEDKEELKSAVQAMLQATIESIGLNEMQTKDFLHALVVSDEAVMRAYLVGLDKDTKIALLEAANFLNAPLLQMMSQKSLEGVATEQDFEKLSVELRAPLMRDAILKALVAYVGWQWSTKVLMKHQSVFSVAFSPDGTKLASGGYDNTVRIWNAETGEQIGEPLRGHTGFVMSVAWSPDGTKLASGSYGDNTVRIWDAQTGEQIGEPLRVHTKNVSSVAWSPNGTKLASGSWDATVRLWDVETGAQIGEPLTGHARIVESVAFSPDGTKLASGSWDRTVRIWDVETGAQIGEPLTGHTGFVMSVAWSPDGTKLAFDSGGKVQIVNAETGEQIGESLTGHTGNVSSVAWSPYGTKLVSGSGDKTVRIWDIETSDQIGEPFTGHTGNVSSVEFSPDGTKLASGSFDGTVRIWQSYYQALVDQCTLNELLVLYQAVPSWREKRPYRDGVAKFAQLKAQYKDSVIAPLLNDERLFASSVSAILREGASPSAMGAYLWWKQQQKK